SGHAACGGRGRGPARQAGRGGRSADAHRPWRPDGASLHSGLSKDGLCHPMIIRETPRLILREWKESDRDLFREINADEKVMEFFPFRRSHQEADAVLETINGMIRGSGYGFYAMEQRETGESMGFCGISPVLNL